MTKLSKTVLNIQNLTKIYNGNFCAVDNVSFHIKSAEVYGLLGVNGAGKTSVISCIMSLEPFTSGRISVFDYDIKKNPNEAKSCVGFVPQEVVNYGFFTMAEVLDFHLGFYGYNHKNSREYKNYILETLDLLEHKDKKVKALSGGMKRRMLIARALLHKPKLVLLDEPTAGVDIGLRQKVKDLVRQLRSEGVSILLTTHYLEEAEDLCDRIGVIHEGKIIQEGVPLDLIKELSFQEITLSFKENKKVKHDYLISEDNGQFKFSLPYNFNFPKLLKDIHVTLDEVSSLKVKEGTLEDVFSRLVSDKNLPDVDLRKSQNQQKKESSYA